MRLLVRPAVPETALAFLLLFAPGVLAGQPSAAPRTVVPDEMRFMQVINGRTSVVSWKGQRAVQLAPPDGTLSKDEDMLAILDVAPFTDGVIETAIAGEPLPGAPPDSRGFVGIAFRTGERGEWSEVFYLRPTNARADDQLRRNHTVQYVSHPDHPWFTLREAQPGVYESYADMVAGEWTPLRIVVRGTTARLFVHGASQPSLVVTDLKHGAGGGRIALWAHVQTRAHFGALTITTP